MEKSVRGGGTGRSGVGPELPCGEPQWKEVSWVEVVMSGFCNCFNKVFVSIFSTDPGHIIDAMRCLTLLRLVKHTHDLLEDAMNKKTKLIGSATGMLAVAAFSGLLAGTAQKAGAATKAFSTPKTQVVAGAKVQRLDGGTHACKGANDCKGQGGCKTGDNGCKGQNSCKGKGGCKTDGSTSQPGLL
jgi:hypothetical protein